MSSLTTGQENMSPVFDLGDMSRTPRERWFTRTEPVLVGGEDRILDGFAGAGGQAGRERKPRWEIPDLGFLDVAEDMRGLGEEPTES